MPAATQKVRNLSKACDQNWWDAEEWRIRYGYPRWRRREDPRRLRADRARCLAVREVPSAVSRETYRPSFFRPRGPIRLTMRSIPPHPMSLNISSGNLCRQVLGHRTSSRRHPQRPVSEPCSSSPSGVDVPRAAPPRPGSMRPFHPPSRVLPCCRRPGSPRFMSRVPAER